MSMEDENKKAGEAADQLHQDRVDTSDVTAKLVEALHQDNTSASPSADWADFTSDGNEPDTRELENEVPPYDLDAPEGTVFKGEVKDSRVFDANEREAIEVYVDNIKQLDNTGVQEDLAKGPNKELVKHRERVAEKAMDPAEEKSISQLEAEDVLRKPQYAPAAPSIQDTVYSKRVYDEAPVDEHKHDTVPVAVIKDGETVSEAVDVRVEDTAVKDKPTRRSKTKKGSVNTMKVDQSTDDVDPNNLNPESTDKPSELPTD